MRLLDHLLTAVDLVVVGEWESEEDVPEETGLETWDDEEES